MSPLGVNFAKTYPEARTIAERIRGKHFSKERARLTQVVFFAWLKWSSEKRVQRSRMHRAEHHSCNRMLARGLAAWSVISAAQVAGRNALKMAAHHATRAQYMRSWYAWVEHVSNAKRESFCDELASVHYVARLARRGLLRLEASVKGVHRARESWMQAVEMDATRRARYGVRTLQHRVRWRRRIADAEFRACALRTRNAQASVLKAWAKASKVHAHRVRVMATALNHNSCRQRRAALIALYTSCRARRERRRAKVTIERKRRQKVVKWAFAYLRHATQIAQQMHEMRDKAASHHRQRSLALAVQTWRTEAQSCTQERQAKRRAHGHYITTNCRKVLQCWRSATDDARLFSLAIAHYQARALHGAICRLKICASLCARARSQRGIAHTHSRRKILKRAFRAIADHSVYRQQRSLDCAVADASFRASRAKLCLDHLRVIVERRKIASRGECIAAAVRISRARRILKVWQSASAIALARRKAADKIMLRVTCSRVSVRLLLPAHVALFK